MTRQSLKNRLDRIRDYLLPPGSMEWRVARLPPHLVESHTIWRERCAAIAEGYSDGALYEAMLDGRDPQPPIPFAVERTLYPEGRCIHLPADATLEQAAAAYQAMLEG